MRYLTHYLSLFNDYYGAMIYKCNICEMYLYTVDSIQSYYLVTNLNVITKRINGVDFTSACSLNCNDYIVKKLLE